MNNEAIIITKELVNRVGGVSPAYKQMLLNPKLFRNLLKCVESGMVDVSKLLSCDVSTLMHDVTGMATRYSPKDKCFMDYWLPRCAVNQPLPTPRKVRNNAS